MKTSSDATISRQNTNQQPESRRRTALKQETQKRQQAENQLLQYRQRSLRIQNQFSRLIEKYDNHVAVINGRLTYGQQIWNKLIKQIENFNSNSQMILQKRCGEITNMMQRRIADIVERTEIQIQKNKKLSEEDFQTIREQIKQVLILAKQIDHQNQEVRKINQQLNFKVNMLREEKNLLVEELAQKKMLLKKLAHHVNEDATVTTIQSPRRTISKRTSRPQNLPVPKFMCEPSIRNFSSIVENPEKTTSRHLLSASKDKKQSKYGTLTENHLKVVIQRQQRKNKELKSMVAKLQNKCKQINLQIEKSLNELKQQDENGLISAILRKMKMKLVVGENIKENGMTFKQLQKLIVM